MNTKIFIYIGIVIGLLIAWHYRAELKDIKDSIFPQVQKTVKLSPYHDDKLEDTVRVVER
jgi:hypothetical protein